MQEQCDKQFCECSHRLKVALNDVVELIIIDEGLLFNANHPMHLHGYKFRVIGMDRVSTKTKFFLLSFPIAVINNFTDLSG